MTEQNFELLLEHMIRMQAKLIEKVDTLNSRMNQMEYVLKQDDQRLFKSLLYCKNTADFEMSIES
ncbi:hypothetical protein [Bacillus tuaregi]|uniref:hypothetical protein n=1 Tax=Bacillus tuaregi TaxID=1816695 RepID=UPI0008F8CAFB|nr:hypothetical protein [Bacillus tuaregi]